MSLALLGYWGKASPSSPTHPAWHPLPYHSLDVACVARAYLEANPSLRNRLGEVAGWPNDITLSTCEFLASVHDIGKAHPGFQSKAPEVFAALFPGKDPVEESLSHAQTGLLVVWLWLRDKAAERTPSNPTDPIDALEPVLNATCGHHGRPQQLAEGIRPLRGTTLAAAQEYLAAVLELFGNEVLDALLGLSSEQARQMSMALAGLFTLSDWVGSSQAYFGYEAPGLSLAEYRDLKSPVAKEAVRQLGLAEPQGAGHTGFAHLFPQLSAPSPLQAFADSMELPTAPALVILEDETGAGKTEAGCTLAARLIAANRASGMLYTLPTQATANAIFSRLAPFAPLLFAAQERPSLTLAHGAARHALDAMNQAGRLAGGISREMQSWASESSKTALLSNVGVCTIDQVALCGLPVKHMALRQLGLLGKVLVIDEAHACEPYLAELLATALTIHARNGGSAVLLSATLPLALKHKFVKAFALGAGTSAAVPKAQAYPLASVFSDGVLTETPISSRKAPRELRWEALAEDQVHQKVDRWLAEGKCVGIIRNTVASAQSTFEEFEVKHPGQCELVHARFVTKHRAANDQRLLSRFGKTSSADQRKGRLVVATQVAEQSLDVDFDELISDLAPMDAILQRAGRRRRHTRDAKGNVREQGPDERAESALFLVMPDPSAPGFLGALPPHTAMVYPMPGVLWRTARYIQSNPSLTIPGQVRTAVEYAYSSPDPIPDELVKADLAAEGKRHSAHQAARFVALNPDTGYSSKMPAVAKEECVTRLGEPSIRIVLCDAHKAPLFGSKEDSQVALRASLLALECDNEGRAYLPMKAAKADGHWFGDAVDHRGKLRVVSYSLSRGLEVFAA